MKRIFNIVTNRIIWITILSFSAFAVPASIHGFILRKQGLSSEQYEWVTVLVFLIALVINLIIARKLFSFKEVGLQRKAFARSFIYSFLFVLVLRLAPDLIYGETISKEGSSQLTFFSLVLLVLTPFYEELLFRGVIFRAWEKSKGFIAAMLVSTTLFGLEHLIYPFWGFGEWSMYAFLRPVIFAPIFTLVAYRTRNIWGLSLSHFLYNASVKLANDSSPIGDSLESYFITLLGFTLFFPL